MSLLRSPMLALAMMTTAGAAGAQTGFAAALDAVLSDSLQNKRGVVVHVDGQRIAVVVRELGADVVTLANQEHRRIVVRRDRIVAVEAD